MARRKRTFNTFNLSFLDIMSCGFGAVVLVFLIMNHAIEDQALKLNENLLAEVDMLDYEVTEGTKGLVELKNTLAELDLDVVDAQGRATRIAQDKEEWEAKIAALRDEGFVENSEVDALKAELQNLDLEIRKLKEASELNSGRRVRSYIGDGNRQYLTGLHLGGRHIVILLDTSNSMLADKLVQIIRLRNMDPQIQRNADKWVRALNTVDWLTAQLPTASKFQLITFDTAAEFALPESGGKWLEVANRAQLEKISQNLRNLVPTGGTSLENAFSELARLKPAADNIFLITDGLPTQGQSPSRQSKISGSDRVKLYRKAINKLPKNVPVNVILFPMEGDPMAASELWRLALSTRGSFLSPSRDWP